MLDNAVWVENTTLLSCGPNVSDFFRRAAKRMGDPDSSLYPSSHRRSDSLKRRAGMPESWEGHMSALDWPKTDRWIMGESWVGSRLGAYLLELTEGSGPRWAGRDGDARAARYIRGLMESLGLDARLEEFELDTWEHGACTALIVAQTSRSSSIAILPMLRCPP